MIYFAIFCLGWYFSRFIETINDSWRNWTLLQTAGALMYVAVVVGVLSSFIP